MANADIFLRETAQQKLARQSGLGRASRESAGIGKTPSRDNIAIEIATDLTSIEAEWRAFETTAQMTPFQSFDWLSVWQSTIGIRRGVRPCIAVARDRHRQIVFILPLAIETFFLWRKLTWLAADMSDYVAPVLDPQFASAQDADWLQTIWPLVCRTISAAPNMHFDFIDIRKIPERIGGVPNPFFGLGVATHASRAHATDLSATWDAFYARRSSTTRRRDRTKMRRLSEHGEIQYVDVTGTDAAISTIETLVRQKSASLQRMGARNIFEGDGFHDFLKELAARPALKSLVHVSELRVGDKTAAASVGLVFHGCYFLILMSYGQGEMARFGPGALHLRSLMQQAIEHGLTAFDFTIGDEPYKLEWSNSELMLRDCIAQSTLFGALPVAGIRMFLAAKRGIKNSDLLWRVYTKARSLLAAVRLRSKGGSGVAAE